VKAQAKMQIVIASGNKNKIKELQTVAAEFQLTLLSPADLQSKGIVTSPPPEVDEVGANYLENALLKAKAYCEWSGLSALGDDSGLEILALDNRPGLLSARYAGVGATDKQLRDKVLGELEQLEAVNCNLDRTAFYVCHLAFVTPEGEELCADFSLKGTMLKQPRGDGGFGYDSIVLIEEFGKTFAEVDFSLTASRGFRAQAAKRLFSEPLFKKLICLDHLS